MDRKKVLRFGRKIYNLYREKGLRGLLNMETKRLRVAFIGCGEHAAENIYPALRYCPAELLAVCARHQESARRAARWFGAANFYCDYKEMLDKEKPDAVIIVVNAGLHPEMAAEALKRGINVFMEKPPSLDLDGTRKIIEEAGKSRKKVMVGFQKRYSPVCLKAKELIQANKLGVLKHIQTKLCTGRMISGEDFILEIGIHHLDLARFFFGEVSDISVKACRGKDGQAYSLNLEFENGAIGSMLFSEQQSWFYHNERIEITGSGNFLEIDNAVRLTYFDQGLDILGVPVSNILGKKRPKAVWEPNFTCLTTDNSQLYQSGIIGELRHFCDCVLNDKEPLTNIEDAYKTMLLVSRVRDAAREKC